MPTDHHRALMISYQTDRTIAEEIIRNLGHRDEAQKNIDALYAEREKRQAAGTWDPFGGRIESHFGKPV
jgi:hypothetical protein